MIARAHASSVGAYDVPNEEQAEAEARLRMRRDSALVSKEDVIALPVVARKAGAVIADSEQGHVRTRFHLHLDGPALAELHRVLEQVDHDELYAAAIPGARGWSVRAHGEAAAGAIELHGEVRSDIADGRRKVDALAMEPQRARVDLHRVEHALCESVEPIDLAHEQTRQMLALLRIQSPRGDGLGGGP
jgi:hypothetical protein